MRHHIFLFTMDVTLDGGVERVVSNMANSFSQRGYQVNIISLFKANQGLKYQIESNIKVKYLFNDNSFDTWRQHLLIKSNLYWRYKLAVKFTSELYAYIDGELKNNETAVVLWNSYLITPLYGHKNVHIIGLDHSRYPFCNMVKGLRHKLHTYMVGKFDIITTLNDNEIVKWQSIGRPVYVMPNFLPVDNIDKQYSVPKRAKIILSMGRMNTNQKGFDRLIDAYSLIAKKFPDWKLVIYGSGSLQHLYRKQIKDLQMQDYIEIYDFTTEPQKIYHTASVYAMCSREEGFPMVLLEAGCKGLPLVAYDIEFGPKTIIKEGETGYIVSDGEKCKFAEALERLMSDEQLRQKISDNIRQDIPARFSEKVIMNQWEKIIKSL